MIELLLAVILLALLITAIVVLIVAGIVLGAMCLLTVGFTHLALYLGRDLVVQAWPESYGPRQARWIFAWWEGAFPVVIACVWFVIVLSLARTIFTLSFWEDFLGPLSGHILAWPGTSLVYALAVTGWLRWYYKRVYHNQPPKQVNWPRLLADRQLDEFNTKIEAATGRLYRDLTQADATNSLPEDRQEKREAGRG